MHYGQQPAVNAEPLLFYLDPRWNEHCDQSASIADKHVSHCRVAFAGNDLFNQRDDVGCVSGCKRIQLKPFEQWTERVFCGGATYLCCHLMDNIQFVEMSSSCRCKHCTAVLEL